MGNNHSGHTTKIEAPVPNPTIDSQLWDPSGWQLSNFKGIPYVAKTQRGVVAKGDIGHALFSTSTFFLYLLNFSSSARGF